MKTHVKRHSTRYAPALIVAGYLLCIGGACADTPGGVATPTAEMMLQPGRPNDSRTHESGTLLALQRRLDLLAAADTADCEAAYAAHKAQAWLNFGKYAAAEQLPRSVQLAALKNTEGIVEVLERHAGSALETPELPGARQVRSDLRRAIAAVKRDGRLCAAPKMTAYCEVELVWVDYEAAAGGWRHVDPYIRIAEDYCSTAMSAVRSPQPEATHDTPVVPERELAVPTVSIPAPPPAEPIDLSLSVVFPHNRAKRSDIRRPGRAELRRLVERSKSLPQGTTILIVGHADLTGHTGYNLRLSKQRAASVAGELRMLGVQAARLRVMAVGSSEPIVQCTADNEVAERRRYLTCLEPNRRVVIQLLPNLL